jgi:hypothetical protein
MAIYGVIFDGTNSAGIRTDDAVGMVWERSTHEVAGRDDFALLSPFNTKECVTKYNSITGKREVLGYKGDAGYDTLRADTANDIMIEFPCFWYQRPSKYTWRISDEPVNGFKPSPMHYHKGKLYKYVRVSKYALNNSYISRTNEYPTYTNMNTFRTNLRAKGQYIMDYPTWCSIVMLSLVKYANMDVQNTVGHGASTGNSTVISGGADSVLGLDGSVGSVSATPLSVVTHGVENIYSNVLKFIDGIYGYNNFFYYKDVLDIISDPSDSTEVTTNFTKINTEYISNSYSSDISDISFDNSYDFGLYPTAIGTPNPSGDVCWTRPNLSCICAGGQAWNGVGCGLFSFLSYYNLGISDETIGVMAIEFSDPIPQKQLYIASDNKVYAMMS